MNGNAKPDRRLSVAPMMEWTDRHCRVFLRAITRRTLLYTEMVHANAIVRGDRERYLGHDPVEHPLALQVGGSDPGALADAARIGADYGYGEINMNVGCPSERVSAGRFGACLMAEPGLVADCVSAMRAATALPVTVKCRIGIDDRDTYGDLAGFVETVSEAGCRVFVVHARKAWLSGLSPKQNRVVPPLRHDVVYWLKGDFPDLEIILNGGIDSLPEALEHKGYVDGVMIGRAAYNSPWILAGADRVLFADEAPPPDRHAVIAKMMPYIEAQCAVGVPLQRVVKHMTGLFNGLPGARAWRRYLAENACRKGAGPEVVAQALSLVRVPEQAASA